MEHVRNDSIQFLWGHSHPSNDNTMIKMVTLKEYIVLDVYIADAVRYNSMSLRKFLK